jgi:putative serine protease PepD
VSVQPPKSDEGSLPSPPLEVRAGTRLGELGGSSKSKMIAAAACGGVLLGAAVAVAVTASVSQRTTIVTTASPFTVTGPASPGSRLAQVLAAVLPTVVAISVISSEETDLGAGVIVRSDGMILTAAHVLANAGSISVTLADGRKSTARVVGRARRSDLAVIQADKFHDLAPATFGSSKQVRIGDDVLVIGNPLGFAGTVARGIVSGTHRSVPVASDQPPSVDPMTGLPVLGSPIGVIRGAIQTDAAINPGTSGGPLLDLRGHVIGIMTAVASKNADVDPDTGLGFAIPSDLAWTIAINLMSNR